MDLERGVIIVCVMNGDYGKPRPAVIIQSNLYNATHGSMTICPITSHLVEAPLFRLLISPTVDNGLKQISQIMVDKIHSISREKIHQKIGRLNIQQKMHLDHALKRWLNLESNQAERLFVQEESSSYL
jgi:mRNA interferase MazF